MKFSLFLLLLLLFLNSVAFAQPTASFVLDKTTACVGDTITMTSTSTSGGFPITNYIWSAQGAIIESAEGSSMTSFKIVYAKSGVFNLGLIVQDQNGMASNEFKMNALQIFENPIVEIVSAFEACKNPFSLNFDIGNSTSGIGILHQWIFGGGSPSSSTGTQATVNFSSQGDKIISLKVTNQNTQCSSFLADTITLIDLIADFQFPASVCQGEAIQLTDQSSSGVNQWEWQGVSAQFSSSTAQNPTVSFNQSGNQNITLISTNTSTGCSDTIMHTINVLSLPAVSFSTDKTTGCASEAINFTNTSTPIAGSIFSWDFGDNTSFNGVNPPAHTYTQNNVLYFPNLMMTGANGCTSTFYGDTIYLFLPEAHFDVVNPLGCEFINVSFLDHSFSPNPITKWFWDFGDGTTSTDQNPVHNFSCGIYDVELIIEIEGGCRDTIVMSDTTMNKIGVGDTITTFPDQVNLVVTSTNIYRNYDDIISNNFTYPTIRYGRMMSTDFTYDPGLQCGSQSIQFVGQNPSCPTDKDIKYKWTFEGFYSSEIPYISDTNDISYTFKDTLRMDNPMDVGLEINFRECISPRTDKVDVIYLKAPISRFNVNDLFCNVGPGPHTVFVFDDASIYGHKGAYVFEGNQVVVDQTNDDVEVEYTWGDGSPNTLITDDALLEDADKGTTSHVFPLGYGTYTITQKITNHTTGCFDQTTQIVNISFVDTDFAFDIPGNDSLCLFTPFTMTETTTTVDSHLPLYYKFVLRDTTYFGEDPNSTFPIPNPHIDTVPGSYNVKLLATNDVGCADSIIHKITIFDLPMAGITLVDDTICKNTNAQFSPSSSILTGYQEGWGEFRWNFDYGVELDTTYDLNLLSRLIDNQLHINLEVVDGFGCVSRNQMNTIIYTQKPVANLTTNPYLCNNVNELIDGSASSGNGTLTYGWYLDDILITNGMEDSLFNTIVVSPPDLFFKDYTYSLIVTDNKGCTDTLEQTVTVSNPRIVSVDTLVRAKYVDANGNYSCPPVVVDFDLTYESNFGAASFAWSFGNDFDSDIDSYNEDPSGIQYVQAGEYDYSITVIESVTGCQFSREESPFLSIGGPRADASITLDTTDQCNQRFLFKVLNPSANLDRWFWNLGDGNIEYSEVNPTDSFFHTYLDVNSFATVLTLIDDETDCIIPISIPVQVMDNGVNAFFTATPMDASMGQVILFDDQSWSTNGPIVSWAWDFGDNTFDTLDNGASQYHVYIDDQKPIVVLTVFNELGCTDQYYLPLILSVDLLIPNIITKPGSGTGNSIFALFANIFKDFDILIVNRWGNIIYQGERDPLNPLYLWNGIDQKSREPVVDGTYFYVIKGTLLDNREVKFQDFVTVINGK